MPWGVAGDCGVLALRILSVCHIWTGYYDVAIWRRKIDRIRDGCMSLDAQLTNEIDQDFLALRYIDYKLYNTSPRGANGWSASGSYTSCAKIQNDSFSYRLVADL
jgi:hypothetical protein